MKTEPNSPIGIRHYDERNDRGWIKVESVGLTKREYFAAMRKEPIFNEVTLTLDWAKTITGSEPPQDKLENIKWWVYAHELFAVIKADALIKALNKE